LRTDTAAVRDAVTAAGVLEHLEAFQAIADANGDTRASSTPGYDASADYVADLLGAAGYELTRQSFEFPFFQELSPAEFERVSPDPETYVEGDDFLVMEYSGAGDVTAVVQPVNDIVIPPGGADTSTAGCEAADFSDADFTGTIALIQRGSCTFAQKALNAEDAGAVGVIIFNEGQDGRTATVNGTLGAPESTIPVVGASFAVGEELYQLSQTGPVVVRLFADTLSEIRSTENVIAETTTGRADRVMVVGAHLDSVPEGPGINDNGSGSATILEIALQMAELGQTPRNRVRFAFWGAEESGLLGSEHYVATSTQQELNRIFLNLNFDMVGSPNYVRFVYDGDGSATGASGPSGSGQIERVFTSYFASEGLESAPTAFDGRSDYGPFIQAGIPAGGLFTGAEGAKTAAQAETYGGLATFDPDGAGDAEPEAVAYDPCYHERCDELDQDLDADDAALYEALNAAYDGALVGNVNTLALDEMSDAAAHAVWTFAQTESAVQGTSRASEAAKAYGFDFVGPSAIR
ncbi:MAG: M20/M25/M40 family metallo-hydrolase, partial [Nitriliruptorales bacterium]|nr:M20/M25/M40 family metallo-hydrolase [Nitriliruptorales bacterium]